MTKEELIALSDLNREDNIKYISSEAQGIAIALDSDRYAPTLCKLERAYICGRRKSEEQIADLKEEVNKIAFARGSLEEENVELRKVAEFQQSSNMNTHLENKKLKEGLTVGSMWNKHLNFQNKALEEERDKYREMTFDQREQLTKAKELLKEWLQTSKASGCDNINIVTDTEQFISEVEK